MEKEKVGPGIVVYKKAIPVELNYHNKYDQILSSENGLYAWQNAMVGYGDLENDHRDCQDFKYKAEHIRGTDQNSVDLLNMHSHISQILKDCLADYGREFGVLIEYIEAFNIVKYGPNDFFNVHSDDGEPYRCTVSCVIYLNDDYEGGELWFNNFDIKIKPDAGDLILFPSSYIYTHAALPVKSGTKYAIVIMTDRNEYAHRKDSPVYNAMENR